MSSWLPTTVASSLADLESLAKEVKRLSAEDPLGDALHFLSNWLVVRSCGHIEITEQACVEDLFDRCFGSVVHHYIDSTAFRSGRNPNPGNLINLLKQIDSSGQLATMLKDYLKTESRDDEGCLTLLNTQKDYLEAIVGARNSIVHGYSFHLTAEAAVEQCEVAKRISEWYLDVFAPQGAAERIILDEVTSERESINAVRRQTAALSLGLEAEEIEMSG